MFTGIVTDVGRIAALERRGRERRFEIETSWPLDGVAIGASVACAGVCLTVAAKSGRRFAVDGSAETLSRSTLGLWREGTPVNLERALALGGELGGHLVSGHVDAVGEICSRTPAGDCLRFEIAAPAVLAPFVAEKGSVAVDGVALTVNGVDDDQRRCRFAVDIVPHTLRATTLGDLRSGAAVNLEIDMLARYLHRMLHARGGFGGRGRSEGRTPGWPAHPTS